MKGLGASGIGVDNGNNCIDDLKLLKLKQLNRTSFLQRKLKISTVNTMLLSFSRQEEVGYN